MSTATINGTTIHYSEVGEGPPCLVLHGGLGFDQHLYQPLEPLGDRLRLVLYDHRGNGRSGRPPIETITIEQLADDAAALADHLGAAEFFVLGHSYGGFIAQELAIRHASRVRGLMLIDTTPGQLGAHETAEEASGPPQPEAFIRFVQAPPATDEELGQASRALFKYYLHRVSTAELEPLIASTVFSVAAMKRGMEILSHWSSIDRLRKVTAPTLLVVGEHDVVCSPSQSYRIARHLPGAEVVLVENCGHFPWFDTPEPFFALVRGWLDRQGA